MGPSPPDPCRTTLFGLPEQFGHYRILHHLGQGGMGSVYLAEDTRLARRVALKVCQVVAGTTPETLKRFQQEARAAAALRHPNLCPVYDWGEFAGIHYLTMAFIDGPTLASVLAQTGPFTQTRAVNLVRKLALAMEAAHVQRVVHRDLKPSNIVLEKCDEPVILDFGLARQMAADVERLTQSGDVMGTTAYMAPEQLQGEAESLGPACDIYSLGVILYELLAGRRPFQGPVGRLIAQILHSEPPLLRELRPEIDPKVEAICLRSLAKNANDRPSSMAQLAADLAACSPPSIPAPVIANSSPPITQHPQTTRVTQATRLLKGTRPSHALVLVLTALLLLLVGGLGYYFTRSPKTRSPDERAEQESAGTASTLGPANEASVPAPELANSLGMSLKRIPAGRFLMGDRGEQQGQVISEDFYLAVVPVTQGQWQAVMGNNPSFFCRGGGGEARIKTIPESELKEFPVEQVSWDEVQVFLERLSAREQKTSWRYRLPTEAEWEYACRAAVATAEEGGFDFYVAQPSNDLSSNQANFDGNYPAGQAAKGPFLQRTTRVGSYKPNRHGLHDLHGNVWQWCSDLYTDGEADRVVRGGGWHSKASMCRAANRYGLPPTTTNDDLGFRVVAVPSNK